MLANLAGSLITHKRIHTTVAKAKALRKYVEPLITKSKDDTTHSRRVVFSKLQNKYVVQMLFDEVAKKVADRPGGYTRIIRVGHRPGDNAEVCMMELVDYNELLLNESGKATAKKGRTRRGRRKSEGKAQSAAKQVQNEDVDVATAEVIEDQVEEAVQEVEAATDQVEETQDEVQAASDEEEAPSAEDTDATEDKRRDGVE